MLNSGGVRSRRDEWPFAPTEVNPPQPLRGRRVNLLSSEKKVAEGGEVWEPTPNPSQEGNVGGVGGKSAFIHAAWDTPRPYPPYPPHPDHPDHPLPKYSSSDKE